jgi:hypothetical protein
MSATAKWRCVHCLCALSPHDTFFFVDEFPICDSCYSGTPPPAAPARRNWVDAFCDFLEVAAVVVIAVALSGCPAESAAINACGNACSKTAIKTVEWGNCECYPPGVTQ